MPRIAQLDQQNGDYKERTSNKKARLLEGKGARQTDGSNLLTMIAVLYAIFIISLIISKIMQ